VPELTIGVTPLWRVRGVGRALLRAIAARARVADSGGRDSDTMVMDL
jgi:GNAT superfamily N-acetyltransferase